MLKRGVYATPYLDNEGRQLVIAVDRNGRKLHEACVEDAASEHDVMSSLRRRLDRDDPLNFQEVPA